MIKINATGDTTLHTAGKYCEEDILVKIPSPKLQNKVINENGTYQADSGFDGLGSVTVEVASSGSASGGFSTKLRKIQFGGDIQGQAILFSNVCFGTSLDNIVLEG